MLNCTFIYRLNFCYFRSQEESREYLNFNDFDPQPFDRFFLGRVRVLLDYILVWWVYPEFSIFSIHFQDIDVLLLGRVQLVAAVVSGHTFAWLADGVGASGHIPQWFPQLSDLHVLRLRTTAHRTQPHGFRGKRFLHKYNWGCLR